MPRTIVAVLTLSLGAGCSETYKSFDGVAQTSKSVSAISGPGVRTNTTPMDPVLACYVTMLQQPNSAPLRIAVGEVRDYTGKQSSDEGFAITQGGSLMAYTALGKLLPAISLHERFDTRIADAELTYGSNRQLGDGSQHSIDDPATGQAKNVPWIPYFGGTVMQSEYYIVGGITEVNYNIRSGGSEFRLSSVGPKLRTYTMNIAVDLRIVGTQSLKVYDTVSVEKQITGYEVGFDVFRFFDDSLFDVNIGQKSQEPLQLGVRLAIETAVLDLVASVAEIDPGNCNASS